MKIRVYFAHLLALGVFCTISSMKKLKIPKIKTNILSNVLKPTIIVTPQAPKAVSPKNYSSAAANKPVPKNTQPINTSFPTVNTTLRNKNLFNNKSLNQAYRQYSTQGKSEYAETRTAIAKQILVRRKIRTLMAPYRYGAIFGNAIVREIVQKAQEIKDPVEVERFVRTELYNLYSSNNSKILSERIIQQNFINNDFHWLFNLIESAKSGVSQHNIKKFYEEYLVKAVESWKKQMREDLVYREQFIAETIKQVHANSTTFKKFKNFFALREHFISDQTKKELEKNNREKIIDEKNNPQEAEKIVSETIEQWVKEKKPFLRKNPKNGFFESDDPKRRNNEQNQIPSRTEQLSRKYWWLPLLAWWLWPKDKEDKLASKTPLEPTDSPAYYTEDLYIYALDGEMALTMDPDSFVKQLRVVGLTVEDAIKIQCQIQEEASYKELSATANLSEHDWNLLHNILKLRHEFFNGNYAEENVTFEGVTDKHVIAMVKKALKKANIPFKVKVHADPTNESQRALGSAGLRDEYKTLYIGQKASIGYMTGESALEFKYHLATGTAGTQGKTIVGDIYLSPKLLSDYSQEGQKAVIAHEVTHIANLHHLQKIFFNKYITKVKGIDQSAYDKSKHILETIFEYQADLLPLADPEYAQAQKFCSQQWINNTRPDIYVTPKKLNRLASRAVDLHDAERRILQSNKK